MTVTFMTGLEAQQAATDNVTLVGTAAYSTAQARTGAASILIPSGTTSSITAGPAAAQWVHCAVYVSATVPSATLWGDVNSNLGLDLIGGGAPFLRLWVAGGAVNSALGLNFSTGWHWVGIRQATGTSVPFVQWDGATVITTTATVSSFWNNFGPKAGQGTNSGDVYVDDIVIDDTGFLQPSKVDMALPISDNTVTGVTDNNGVTTNIWQCVDATPPAGVASANEAANAKAGMHFTASVTDNYLANLETYTTLGVGASDTVLAVRGIVRTGEDIATGTKNLQNVAALTNPTVAGSSVTAGNDGGAHAAEVGLWVTTFGTLTTSPSVTLGTSPTIRTSRTSESRLACVDFMGMLVAWTPAAAAAVPYVNIYPPLLAQ